MEEPVIELLDGRRVRLLSIAARDGRLEVECRTEGGGGETPASLAMVEPSRPSLGSVDALPYSQ